MMTQPAGATGAAHKSGTAPGATPADGVRGGGADILCTSAATTTTTTAAPFSQALQTLQALAANLAGDEPAAGAPDAATADSAAADKENPPNDARMLPQEWLLGSTAAQPGTSAPQLPAANSQPPNPARKVLSTDANASLPSARARTAAARQPAAAPALPMDLVRALFAMHSALPAQEGAQPCKAAGDDDDRRTGSTDADTAAGNASPIQISTLVLVPLPAQSGAIGPAPSASAASAGRVSDAGQLAVTQGAGARQDLAAAVAGMAATPPGAASAGPLLSQSDAQLQTTAGDSPRLPRDFADADSAVGAMNMAAALRATSAAGPGQAEHSVAVPVHDRHWPTAMAAQVLILSSDRVRSATLRLSPEHLGPVEVHIDMQDSNVNVNFTAAHAETRAALEQAMPQLRTVLAGAGLTLGQATVQQQARRESQNSSAPARAGGAADDPIEAPVIVTRTLGMIDEYV